MRWNEVEEHNGFVLSDSGVIGSAPDDSGEARSPRTSQSPRTSEVRTEGGPQNERTTVVYVPSEQVRSEIQPETKVELRYLADGTLTLPVYSSLDDLTAGCGAAQPWVAIPADSIDEFRRLIGAELAVLDPELPGQTQHDRRRQEDPRCTTR